MKEGERDGQSDTVRDPPQKRETYFELAKENVNGTAFPSAFIQC